MLSAGDTTFKYDLGSEEADGTQTEWISVFTRGGDGSVRHVYSKGAQMADDRRERGIDLLSPLAPPRSHVVRPRRLVSRPELLGQTARPLLTYLRRLSNITPEWRRRWPPRPAMH
jgi:hypothetical protein